MSKVTPRPWHWFSGSLIGRAENGELSHIVKCESLSSANASHIVKCVNLHDDLVKALNDLSLEAIGFVGQADPADHGHTNINVLNRKIEVARALVAKAESK